MTSKEYQQQSDSRNRIVQAIGIVAKQQGRNTIQQINLWGDQS